MIYSYRGKLYPEYLKTGNACRFIQPMALEFCKGVGLDIGAGKWPLPGAIPIDITEGKDAMAVPINTIGDDVGYDYIFSSHCLEHLIDPVAALELWKSRLKFGGVLFLYLPHPDMTYWLPQNNRKHLHTWTPAQMAQLVEDLGFENIIQSERDLAWGFAVVGFKPRPWPRSAQPTQARFPTTR